MKYNSPLLQMPSNNPHSFHSTNDFYKITFAEEKKTNSTVVHSVVLNFEYRIHSLFIHLGLINATDFSTSHKDGKKSWIILCSVKSLSFLSDTKQTTASLDMWNCLNW